MYITLQWTHFHQNKNIFKCAYENSIFIKYDDSGVEIMLLIHDPKGLKI